MYIFVFLICTHAHNEKIIYMTSLVLYTGAEDGREPVKYITQHLFLKCVICFHLILSVLCFKIVLKFVPTQARKQPSAPQRFYKLYIMYTGLC